MNGKYHLLSIGIILSIIYLGSYLSAKAGFISMRLHGKIWNSVLLLSFVIAGVTGVFFVILINYKIEIPIVDQLMMFHVDFGIALFITSVFHIFFHWNYFKHLFDKPKEKLQKQKKTVETVLAIKTPTPKWILMYSIVSLGITAMVTQIVFLREFISVFSGNELLFGILMSIWLIITGTGALSFQYASKFKNIRKLYLVLQLLTGLLPVITLFLLLITRNFVFQIGVQVNYMELLAFSFFLLLPFCFLSGFMFSLLVKLMADFYPKKVISLNYSIESLGSLIGSFIFSFILVFVSSGFQTLFIILIINLIAIFFNLSNQKSLFIKFLFYGFFLMLLVGTFTFDLEKTAKGFLFQNQKIESIYQSPYGQLIITENSGQLNFYRNGNYFFSSDSVYSTNANIATDEENVHFAMLQYPIAKNVLIISGGLGGSINEVLKYPVSSIDYIEIDPVICHIAMKHNKQLSESGVNVINRDARDFLRHTSKNYDVVLLNTPPPSGTETNRFYTDEFFKILRGKMTVKSVLALSLPSTVNYPDEFSLLSNRMIYNTLANNFKHVTVFPGEKNYFIASDDTINTSVVSKITELNIENEYVGYYLDDVILEQRSNQLTSQIKGNTDLNKDLKPMSYLLYIKQQWSIFKGSSWILGLFIFLLFILSFRKFNRVRFAMFATGFASISSELAVIYLFQMVFGNAYQYTGIIFTIFMAGLVVGPLLPNIKRKLPNKKVFMFLLIIFGLWVLAMPILVKVLLNFITQNLFLYAFFFIFTFLVAFFTGYIFKLAAQQVTENEAKLAGQIYSADLFGSAFGAILVSVFIIPLLGLLWSGLPGFVLCIAASALITKQ